MSKTIMIGVGVIVLFFLANMLSGIPVIGGYAQPVAQLGILLPAGLALIFMGQPQVMFIVFIGGILFLIGNGVPLVP